MYIIDCWKKIPRTLAHYRAFLKLEKKMLGRYKYKFHDLDKVFMYAFLPFLGLKIIKKIHRKFNRHHLLINKKPWQCNYEEAMIDWECSRFTKPDEPMNAREFMEYAKDKIGVVHSLRMHEMLNHYGL